MGDFLEDLKKYLAETPLSSIKEAWDKYAHLDSPEFITVNDVLKMSKKTLPRFGIFKNEMADPDSAYVIHTQEPRFIAKYTPDGPMSDFEIVQEIDNISAFFGGDPLRMAGLMRRLGDWWVAYKKWEEDNSEG